MMYSSSNVSYKHAFSPILSSASSAKSTSLLPTIFHSHPFNFIHVGYTKNTRWKDGGHYATTIKQTEKASNFSTYNG